VRRRWGAPISDILWCVITIELQADIALIDPMAQRSTPREI
jgi:hypothetical protein